VPEVFNFEQMVYFSKRKAFVCGVQVLGLNEVNNLFVSADIHKVIETQKIVLR
jgi:hypothetical protein